MKPLWIAAVAVIGCGVVGIGIWKFSGIPSPSAKTSPSTVETMVQTPPPPVAVIHTPEWYEQHQDVLRTDNERCQALGTKIPAQLCENVSIANHNVSSDNLLKALDQASSPGAK